MRNTGRWVAGLALGAAALAGCAEDRQAVLIGKWETSEMFAPAMAFKLKQGAPEGVNPTGAAFALSHTEMEIRKDRTFRLGLLGHLAEGTWIFNKQSGQVRLNVVRVQHASGRPQLQTGDWVANLDPDNTRLRVFPGSAETQALAQQSGGGGLGDGIPLRKAER